MILLFSVVIHEISHGYAALFLGDNTAKYQGRLTINPINHLDPMGSVFVPLLTYFLGGFIIGWAKPVPFNPYNLRNQRWGEAIVALAGPLSNLVIASVFAILIRFLPDNLPEGFYFLAGYLIFINIVLALFNLMPVPPLDGSKILFSILPQRLYHIRQAMEQYGFVLVLIFIFVLWRFLVPVAQSIFILLVGHNLL